MTHGRQDHSHGLALRMPSPGQIYIEANVMKKRIRKRSFFLNHHILPPPRASHLLGGRTSFPRKSQLSNRAMEASTAMAPPFPFLGTVLVASHSVHPDSFSCNGDIICLSQMTKMVTTYVIINKDEHHHVLIIPLIMCMQLQQPLMDG